MIHYISNKENQELAKTIDKVQSPIKQVKQPIQSATDTGVAPVGSTDVAPVGSTDVAPVGSTGVAPVGGTGVATVEANGNKCIIMIRICIPVF